MIARTLRAGLILAGALCCIPGCSSGAAPAGRGGQLGEGDVSSDGTIKFVSIKLDLAGRANAQGATCFIQAKNPSQSPLKRRCRVVYYSHTGAELLYPEEVWSTLELAAGEERVFEHTCPFRTAKQARLLLE